MTDVSSTSLSAIIIPTPSSILENSAPSNLNLWIIVASSVVGMAVLILIIVVIIILVAVYKKQKRVEQATPTPTPPEPSYEDVSTKRNFSYGIATPISLNQNISYKQPHVTCTNNVSYKRPILPPKVAAVNAMNDSDRSTVCYEYPQPYLFPL